MNFTQDFEQVQMESLPTADHKLPRIQRLTVCSNHCVGVAMFPSLAPIFMDFFD